MNRNRPPAAMPAPGFQTPLFAGAQHAATQQAQPLYSPECLEALIRQSESNYMIARERTMKFDEGAGTLEMETQNMSIELANRGMTSSHDPMLRANEVMRQEMRAHRSLLDALLRSELALQGNFKRWASGQMPALSNPAASMFNAPMPPPPPIPGGQYSQSAATTAQAQGPFQPQQGFAPPPPGVPPPMPLGAVDYRDPRQAAEALLRAAPMPMVPQQQPVLQQQPQAPYPYPHPQQQAAYPYPQQQMPPQYAPQQPQYAYPVPQQQPMPMQQQEVAPTQQAPMPTSMQFEQPPPAQQAPHQAAPAQVNGAAKA